MKKIYLLLIVVLLSIGSFAQYSTLSFQFQGVTRQYLLYVPASYDGSTAVPFILALHGLGDNMNNFKGVDFNSIADTANFIFAIPQALVDSVLTGATAWNSGASAFGYTLNPNVDDVGFLNAIIDSTSLYYNIDQTRLYATGFSMGGFMTNRLGCELNNRIAAIASVSGTIGSGITCTPGRVVPSCHFHGTADQTVAYTGDMYGSDAEALVAFWRGHDGCDSVPSSIDTLPHISADSLHIVHYVYPNGRYGSDVEFYKVINGVHQWLGPTGADINYAAAIWKFFNRYQWVAQTTGINTVSDDPGISIYPNPASALIRLNVPRGASDLKEVVMRDISGRVVYQSREGMVGNDMDIDVGSFARGIYTVQVRMNELWVTKKVCLTD
jgi:polyhydroxybutyrate depolymerase